MWHSERHREERRTFLRKPLLKPPFSRLLIVSAIPPPIARHGCDTLPPACALEVRYPVEEEYLSDTKQIHAGKFSLGISVPMHAGPVFAIHARKSSRGPHFCVNTCGPCIRADMSTGEIFEK